MIGRIYISFALTVILWAFYQVVKSYASSDVFLFMLVLFIVFIASLFWGSTRHHITEKDLKDAQKLKKKIIVAKKIFGEMLDL